MTFFACKVTTKVTESTATFVPKSLYGWLYKRDGDFTETIQRFLAKLKDSGNFKFHIHCWIFLKHHCHVF